ncbi:MAG: amidophosphoribosyltransferase [bacterium]|nr:amidophosphoribosyltransferase [bacterium]
MREYCGIVGVSSKKGKNVADILYLALFSLQHRGQESAGIVTYGKDGHKAHRGFGQVKEVFTIDVLNRLDGYAGIGHTRYSTFGSSNNFNNIQPLYVVSKEHFIAVAHNGTLTNYKELRSELESHGYVFHSTTDSEIFLYLFSMNDGMPLEERFLNILKKVKGAYSLLFLIDDAIYFLRDPWGFRPLVYGESEDYFMVASETPALRHAGIHDFKELKPGGLGIFKEGRLELKQLYPSNKREQCVFELIYFSRPDSITFGKNVYKFRRECGKELALLETEEIDIVVPVPDSGLPASVGYASKIGKPLEFGLMRSHYTGRSFIEPYDRDKKVRMKLIPIEEVLKGKRVALIDDSLVRGTTSKEIVKLLREHGAREVHLRFASPPIIAPCFFGIDIPTREVLLASSHTLEELTEILGADSVMYLPMSKLKKVLGDDWKDFCFSCFTGSYNQDTVSESIYREFLNYKPPILMQFESY